ncbi:hypothetical protein JCM19231_2279 [Vibrio ishigakensis]|uniref:Uncharacterized protein n=1 Tax=Vibrio ishigakensis TaxID=1481914 RepID=A0A0B8NI75_9VIBR|nr:hypothetical protein JCM19231_2279 [Vibrio ishigakensis]
MLLDSERRLDVTAFLTDADTTRQPEARMSMKQLNIRL